MRHTHQFKLLYMCGSGCGKGIKNILVQKCYFCCVGHIAFYVFMRKWAVAERLKIVDAAEKTYGTG